ncbi:MAG: glycosyltransferase [Elusimicrobiota bacterium]|jgi:glycosyltransferase involved in cell wall biosynthesis
MIQNLSFVVFGDEWGLHASSTQHLASRLADTQPLLYVNAVGMRCPRLNLRDMKRVMGKLQQWLLPDSKKTPVPSKLHVYSPIRIPFNSVAAVREWNSFALARGTRQQLRARGMESPVLFVSSPVGAEVANKLGEQLLIYYITDDYPALPGVDRAYVESLENKMLSEADLIFATSEELQRKKQGAKAPTLLLPHGVNFEHFHSTADPLGPIPEEMKNLPRPILGFYGLLAPWVNADLLIQVAQAFPRASVVLIGPEWSDYKAPKGAPNLHWLGPRSYTDLPRYAAHFDVGLITFKQDRLTASVNPLKLLEYLALGLPVVSTPLPSLERFTDFVYTADNPSDFIRQVQRALDDTGPQRRQQRFALAAAESWEARVAYVFQEIEAALSRRKTS